MGNLDGCCDSKTHLHRNNIPSISLNDHRVSSRPRLPSQPAQTVQTTQKCFVQDPVDPNILDLITTAKTRPEYKKQTQLQGSQLMTRTYKSGKDIILVKGLFKNNNPILDGWFTAYLPDGTCFHGQFVNNQPQNGIFVSNATTYYVGDISSFMADGKGYFVNKTFGHSYEGQFKKGLPHGEGCEQHSNGDVFRGNFIFGKMFGEGVYKFADGTIYEGSFFNGYCDGLGKIKYPNNSNYSGNWKLGVIEGQGTYIYPNGDKFAGTFKNGRKNQEGTYYFKSGVKYTGSWEEGLQHGKGRLEEGYDEIYGNWIHGEQQHQYAAQILPFPQ